MTARLYTFTISHFAEKARWALDYKGIHYQEKRLVPGSHFPIVKRIAPRTCVPVLRDAGCVIQGSSATSTTSTHALMSVRLRRWTRPSDNVRSSSNAGSIVNLGSRFAASSTSTRSTILVCSSPY